MIKYHVYGNGGTGGPIDYSAVLATVADTSWASPALATGDWRFGVRAFDDATGLEEKNADAAVQVRVAADGTDLGSLPAAPEILGATPVGGGVVRVDALWRDAAGRTAAGFGVTLTPGGALADLPGRQPGAFAFSVTPTPGVATTIALSAKVGATASAPATTVVTLPPAGPEPPESLTATLTDRPPA